MKRKVKLCKNRRTATITKYQGWNKLCHIPKTQKAIWLKNSQRKETDMKSSYVSRQMPDNVRSLSTKRKAVVCFKSAVI